MRDRTNYTVVRTGMPLARTLVATALEAVGERPSKVVLDKLTRSVYNALRREARKEKLLV